MTTRLPSTGASEIAAGPAATCRSDEVVVIHRLFRRLFAEAPDLVRDVAPGDTAHARYVAKHLHGIIALLHVHHRTEDEYFWDVMGERAPACGMHVALMRRQHGVVSDRLDVADAVVDRWARTADDALADRLAGDLDEIDRLLVEHLADEEREAFPVLDAILSDAEWDDIHKHARRHKPPLPIFVLLGLMIDSVPESERDAWFEKELPAPIRVAYRMVGRRQYERAIRRLRTDRTRAAVPATASAV
ncbi:hemerythrin domain-containing protein [Agromyces sp. SYSU K20354]|uniref:hemerythrin domain-containing protein n=1 Tax=Agromyces cavernae TaxID=2898659 RepID=UPI001E332DE7|nr:hemerythrin domain-containing protein [Agromyces cavernae]MCD2442327.1 hemerythrin domain-containing protein [Agromyces cavernae]